jgi:peroxiredoxin
MSSTDKASRVDIGTRSSDAGQPNSRLGIVALTVMLAASVALNVMLSLRVRELTSLQNAVRAHRELEIGTAVPPITAKRLDGRSEAITYVESNRPTVLYIFTPQCGWCARNLNNLRTLVGQRGGDYRFIGISLSKEGLEKYVADHQLTFPVYTDIPKELGEAYKMGGTPQTVVISPQGQVIQNWVGAYAGDEKSQVEAYFNITLPGIQPKAVDESNPTPP